MSSRMTFSLFSLIFLLTLGLVFVPASVMADNGDLVGGNHNPSGHPNQDDANNTQSSQPKHVHPKPTLSLKAGSNVLGNEVIIAAETDAGAVTRSDEFTVVIDFNMDVSNSSSDTASDTTNTANIDNINDFDQAALNASGATISGVDLILSDLSGLTPAGPAAINRVTGDNSKFEVRFRVPSGGIPTGTGALKTVTYRILLLAGRDAYGLGKVW